MMLFNAAKLTRILPVHNFVDHNFVDQSKTSLYKEIESQS